jgi:SAM-dependent methyltransferase
MKNADPNTVKSFGSEWSLYTQSEDDLPLAGRTALFESYFHIFPWQSLPQAAIGADVGCGSGRWAAMVAPRVGHLYAIDPAPPAVHVARRNLRAHANVTVIEAECNAMPIENASLDFAYCLGVLHHIPDTQVALAAIVAKLKMGAPILLYLYYAFDNRPFWYRAIWRVSELGRGIICRLPRRAQQFVTTIVAATVYWPLARAAYVLSLAGVPVSSWPLSYYADKPFYVLRTDAYDRFCTPLEKRFSRSEIEQMMLSAGLSEISFSEAAPYWVVVGRRQSLTRP